MIKLAVLMLLLTKTQSDTKPPRLPDSEYIDFDIIPTLIVTKVYYIDMVNEEKLTVGLGEISLLVTNIGGNPL